MKLLFAYILQGQVVGVDAGVVDKDAYIAELFLCLVKEAIDLLREGHASLHSDGPSAGGFDFSDHAVCASPIRVIVHRNGGALIRQRQRDACPDSFRCSCYQCDLSIKLSHSSISWLSTI
jgi:hypothetical protein